MHYKCLLTKSVPDKCSMHGTINNLSDLLHLHCGTASQIISGLRIASLNSRVFCSPGMGPNVAVLRVDD